MLERYAPFVENGLSLAAITSLYLNSFENGASHSQRLSKPLCGRRANWKPLLFVPAWVATQDVCQH